MALPGVWLGLMLAVAFIAAPSAFTQLPKAEAGLFVRELFSTEASCSLGFGALLLLLENRDAARVISESQGSRITPNLMLLMGCIMATVIGYFALQPLMIEARKGLGSLSFNQLHAISLGFYALKLGLVAAVTYRNTPVELEKSELLSQSSP
jgi:hypothetical protein